MGDFDFDGRMLNVSTTAGLRRFPAIHLAYQEHPCRHVYVPCENGLHIAVSWLKGSYSSNFCTLADSPMCDRPYTVEMYGVWVHGARRLLLCECRDKSAYSLQHDGWRSGFNSADRAVELIARLSLIPTGDTAGMSCNARHEATWAKEAPIADA